MVADAALKMDITQVHHRRLSNMHQLSGGTQVAVRGCCLSMMRPHAVEFRDLSKWSVAQGSEWHVRPYCSQLTSDYAIEGSGMNELYRLAL